jgi:glycosyltransferase involved in cell wall biosynthesis
MKIRSFTWGAADLSWSVVMEELLNAAQKDGHSVDFISTNGSAGMMYWNEKKISEAIHSERSMIKASKPYDLDIVFTVPQNFPQRFLSSSKVKMALYDYESSHMPAAWTKYYSMVDFVLPSSQYVADMFERNGCPKDKIKVVPHGIDLDVFNPNVPPMKLPTQKKFKFLCVAAPHYRKQLPHLIETYFKIFTSSDDVSLILKTKIFKPGEKMQGFEVNVGKEIAQLKAKYGSKAPELVVINEKITNMASLYTACDAFALMTSSEGWGIPFLEAMACGLPTIAPRFGGQLDFMNDRNSILTECGIRRALPQEQYWGITQGATTGCPNKVDFADKMMGLYKNYEKIVPEMKIEMSKTVKNFTWELALRQIVEIARSTGRIP